MVRPRARPSTSSLLTTTTLLSTTFSTVFAASSSFPKVDFSSLGTVAVVGSFAGLSLYDPTNPPPTFDASRSTVLARRTDGTLTKVGQTDEGGSIDTVCQSPDGTLYVGGNFTRVDDIGAVNIARYDLEGRRWETMGNGLDGQVRALSCNGSTVYAGGEFGPVSEGGGPNVAAWSTEEQNWVDLPFYGFDGAVETIDSSRDGQSVFFGGSFSTTFSNSTSTTTTGSSSVANPDAAGNLYPSLGSSLSPISLNQSDYWASPTTYTSGFGRPEYVFCPKKEDGIGSSWLLVDGAVGFFIVRLYRELNVRGIRLGNTFYEGRGTRNFSLVSIPDNQVLELTYSTDPSNPSAGTSTCSDNCILAHNSSIPYQDFLFPEGTTMTGFQLNVNGWYGAGGGLHLIQLLSQGSYAYATESSNVNPCTNGLGAVAASSVETDGNWTTREVDTSIAGTTQQVLVATVPGGSTTSSPSITWSPSVPQDGNYAVYFHTPGCTRMENCGVRTSVKVTASPTSGSANSTTIEQTNADDRSTLIYNGTLSAGTDTFTVSMSLADGAASNSGTNYQIIADYINLVAASTNGTSTQINRGYGLYEYAVGNSQGTFGDSVVDSVSKNASSIMTNSTGFDALAFDLNQGASVSSIVTIGEGQDTRVFVGGEFTYTARQGGGGSTSQNVVVYSAGQPQAAPNGGLDGRVDSLLELNGALYAAGTFETTSDGSITGLDGFARWNYSSPSSSSWEKLGGSAPSVVGSIAGLAVVNTGSGQKDGSEDAIAVVGGGGSGLAFYDPSRSNWNSSMGALLLGNLTAVGGTTDLSETNATTFYAGNIQVAIQHATPGGAVLSSGKNGQPRLSSFGFDFGSSETTSTSPASSSSAPTSSRFRRSDFEQFTSFDLLTRSIDPRSSRLVLEPRAPAPSPAANLTLPTPIQAIASSTGSSEEVLAGAFWKNGSTELMLVGGSFVSSEGVRNVGAYDPKAQNLTALAGEDLVGTVTNLLVVDDTLWIGGNFSTANGRQGFTTYNLKAGQTDDSQPPLSGYAGNNATLNVIAQRPGYDSEILVAGAFASAGSLPCQSVCLWDTGKLQWSSLGGGLQGAVGSIDFAGSNSQYLIAAGEFLLDSSTAYIAKWNFKNSTWSGIGAPSDLPGPATAFSADDSNLDKLFVAGRSTSGSPYLAFWNGSTWTDINNNTLAAGSGVQQLAFVPLQSDHESNDIIEKNRMLLVSGALNINDTSLSAALYDGQDWYPYLVSSSATGSAGVISQLFYSSTSFSLSGGHHLAVGIVILISIAIALGVIFLLVLIGLLIALSRRKDEPQYPPNRNLGASTSTTSSAEGLHRPNSLLQTVGAATAVLLDPKGEKGMHHDHDSITGGGMDFDGAAMSYGSDYGDDGEPSTALARYSFSAENQGELSISANEQLSILEATDPNWWMVANSAGQRGLVPQTYLA
ncbi:Rax2p [Sporobolomyces salmoneus]|uniref:Rax2p n=1 Tax=Sporobolomyces salmoneus TaxID=183962 RepID=UPI00316AFBCB